MIRSELTSPVPTSVDGGDILEALSSDASREILAVCADEPRPVKEICDHTGLPSSTAYRHVNALLEQGLLERSRTVVKGNGSRTDMYTTPFDRLQLRVDEDGVTLVLDGDVLDG